MEESKEKKIKSVFDNLHKVNVTPYVEKKDKLSYLSWAVVWGMISERYPNASYERLPYEYDEKLGYMVSTSMTIEGTTRYMWLPVMDEKNKAMKSEPYVYTTKYGEKRVDAATMFDINTAYMRCLVKNAAMFGLGLDIYINEDLPPINVQSRIDGAVSLRELNDIYMSLSEDEKSAYKEEFSKKKEIINNKNNK